MKHKYLHLTLLLSALLALFAALTVSASAATSGDYTYTVSNGKATITDCSTSVSGAITIPATLGGYPVTSIGELAFCGCSSLESVVIPSSVTSFGRAAFGNCSSLKSVEIQSRLKTIAEDLFRECSSLTSIVIPSSVTSIGDYAFSGCDSLTSVVIPSGVTSIGSSAFAWCSRLTSITIPSGVTSIGQGAFAVCESLMSVEVASGNSCYKSIDGVLFNKSGTTLICYPAGKADIAYTIPDNVISIEGDAFCYCNSLTSVTIPTTVRDIGWCAFQACDSLSSFKVASGNSCYKSIDGVLFNKSGTTLICYPAGKTDTSYEIPSGVTSIKKDAFYKCNHLRIVTISSGVTSIGDDAFYGCGNLVSVEVYSDNQYYESIDGVLFNESGTELICYPAGKTDAFYMIPSSVIKIEHGSFAYCANLISLMLGNNIEIIGYEAFRNSGSLESITIPNTVTSIGGGAFYSCSSLTDIYYAGTDSKWFDNLMDGEPLPDITVHCYHTHEYSDMPDWAWTDFSAATATFTCRYDDVLSVKATVTSAVTKPATKTATGVRTYTATVNFNGKVYTDERTKEIPMHTSAGRQLLELIPCNMDGEKLYQIPKEKFSAQVTVLNETENGSGAVALAVYDQNGKYLTMQVFSFEGLKSDDEKPFSMTVNNTSGRVKTLKAFVLPSASEFIPIGKSLTFEK